MLGQGRRAQRAEQVKCGIFELSRGGGDTLGGVLKIQLKTALQLHGQTQEPLQAWGRRWPSPAHRRSWALGHAAQVSSSSECSQLQKKTLRCVQHSTAKQAQRARPP